MQDKPGSPDIQDEDGQRMLALVAGLDLAASDGLVGVRALANEIEARYPGALERLSASLQLRRLRREGVQPN